MLGNGGATNGAGLAAISANAAKGIANRTLLDINLPETSIRLMLRSG
jgi:hypothetical protein